MPTSARQFEQALEKLEKADSTDAQNATLARKVIEALDERDFDLLRGVGRVCDHVEIAAMSRRSLLRNQIEVAAQLAKPWFAPDIVAIGASARRQSDDDEALSSRQEIDRFLALLGLSSHAVDHLRQLLDQRLHQQATNDLMQALKTQIHPLADLAFRLAWVASTMDPQVHAEMADHLGRVYGTEAAVRRFIEQLTAFPARRDTAVADLIEYLKVFG
jgi:hypothetical protein